jgi:hypothetical protein
MVVQFYFYSILAPESFFHKQMYRVLSPSQATVLYSVQYTETREGKILTDGSSVLFLLHHGSPESFFHKLMCRVLTHSYTTILYIIQRLDKGKILTDGSSVLFLLHHGARELLPQTKVQCTVTLTYYSIVQNT